MNDNKTYFRNIGTLFSSSILATLIPVLLAPVLTRQYSPAEFGVFAFFVAIADIILVFSTLRLTYAIVIPKNKDDAWFLFVTCLLLSLIFSSLVFLLALFIPTAIYVGIGGEIVYKFLPFAAPYVFFCVLYTSAYAWHNRNGRYKTIAIARVISVSVITITSILFGFLQYGPLGLILGVLCGKIISSIFMVFKIWKVDIQDLPTVTIQHLILSVKQNKRFPLYSVPAGLFNMAAYQMPIFVLKAFFSATVLGLYDLTHRVLAAPAALVGTAIQDVFKVRASQEYAESGSCNKTYLLTLSMLTTISILFYTPLYFFAPLIFGNVFGEEWRVAGDYAKIMIPFIAIRFIASSLSYVLFITSHQKTDLVWQICLAFAMFLSIYIGSKTNEPETGIQYLSYAGICMYLIYILLSLLSTLKSSTTNV
jgi:O-antigen/teichoic acid export membrane protein